VLSLFALVVVGADDSVVVSDGVAVLLIVAVIVGTGALVVVYVIGNDGTWLGIMHFLEFSTQVQL